MGMPQHIVAIGGGGLVEYGGRRPMLEYVLSLAGTPRPRATYIGTAMGDDAAASLYWYDATRDLDVRASHLELFAMPNVPDVRAHLLAQDLVYVGGGSTANLLAVWRAHGLDEILREAWQQGTVLAGTSAGSICWFEGGPTDSFGPALRPLTNGLAFLPASHAPHYDSEAQRRPLYQRLVRDGALPPGWAADETVGLVFEGTAFSHAVSYGDRRAAWRVTPEGETRVEPQRI
jgi:peptidase E